jgi:hypothetical protein
VIHRYVCGTLSWPHLTMRGDGFEGGLGLRWLSAGERSPTFLDLATSVCDELVDGAIRATEMLPARARCSDELDAGSSKFFDSARQVSDGEASHWSGSEVIFTWVVRHEDFNMTATG